MSSYKASYFKILSGYKLTTSTICTINDFIKKQGLEITAIEKDSDLLKKTGPGESVKVTEQLTRLELFAVRGNPSWEGLMVGFPGNRYELSTQSVGTPYLRMILYPILDLHHRLQDDINKDLPDREKKRFPCIYFVGNRFSDVFLRKFELLNQVIPNIIVLTHDLYECSQNKRCPPKTDQSEINETWTQMKLCELMDRPEGLIIPIAVKHTLGGPTPPMETETITAKFLSNEVPCSEGTDNPERLDILGYDASDHSLVAFEIKGQNASRVELENLLLQGMEHRNWLEKNKMAVKLLFDGGPKGRRINTRKRVRLLLGFYGSAVPHIFEELRKEAKRRDPYTEINFVQLTNDLENDTVSLSPF